MNLPINVFEKPYEHWEMRNPSDQEMKEHLEQTGQFLSFVKGHLKNRVDNHFEAAKHIMLEGADNGLESFIDNNLQASPAFKALRNCMPSKTPKSIADYQQRYPNCDFLKVTENIESLGTTLVGGSFLFHGGFWQKEWGSVIKTNKPLSTSFCPQVALRNAEWKGKAYDSGEIHLFVLNVVNPQTKVFALRIRGTNLGREKEVLFSSGATLTLRNKALVKSDYGVIKVVNGYMKR